MNDRDIISLALSGERPDGDDDAVNIIGMALEKACHEAECLRLALDANDDALIAGSLHGRLKALGSFIDRHMDVKFRPVVAAPVLRIAEGSAKP
jgi:hypothetical protein